MPLVAVLGVVFVGALAGPAHAHRRLDDRLRVRTVPDAPRAGERFTVHLKDRRRRGGFTVTVCLASGADVAACRRSRVGAGAAVVPFTAPRIGRWVLTVRGHGVRIRQPLTVRPVGDRISVLAVGDSLMVRVARHVTRMLESRQVHVGTDIQVGASISNSFVLDWRARARATVAARPPDVVVLFLGGSEGWPFGSIDCCGPAWIAEYARRAREIMQTYMRQGAAQVYWLTLPAPESPRKAVALHAADEGLARAVAGLEPWARLVNVTDLLTPGFVYRPSMLIDGRPTILRMADGLHLSRAGAILTAHLVVSKLRDDNVIVPPVVFRRN